MDVQPRHGLTQPPQRRPQKAIYRCGPVLQLRNEQVKDQAVLTDAVFCVDNTLAPSKAATTRWRSDPQHSWTMQEASRTEVGAWSRTMKKSGHTPTTPSLPSQPRASMQMGCQANLYGHDRSALLPSLSIAYDHCVVSFAEGKTTYRKYC